MRAHAPFLSTPRHRYDFSGRIASHTESRKRILFRLKHVTQVHLLLVISVASTQRTILYLAASVGHALLVQALCIWF